MPSLSFTQLSFLLLASAGYSVGSSYGGDCCSSLKTILPLSKVAYPKTAAYSESVSSYWAKQAQLLSPSCIVLPTTATDVSSTLKILVSKSCKFAVRSGGHGSVTGISSIQGGVTIDMRGLNLTTLSSDKKLVSVGGGQVWHGVYSALYPAGLTVPGGRDSNIGVGGSTLGGALGYIAPSAGFGADSVVEYEIVLANGSIVTATKDLNSDLWRALKGGGSNFGIVTKFVFRTTPLGDIWAGNSAYDASALDSEIQAFYDFTANPNYDTKSDLMMTYHYTADGGVQLANGYAYAEPVNNPPAFNEFYPIKGQFGNITSVTNVPDFSVTQQATSPGGFRQITFAMTFRNSVQQLRDVWTIYNKSIPSVAKIEGISWSLTFEPITPSLAAASKARGGNVMGLEAVPPEGLVVTLGSVSFSSADYLTMSRLSDQLLNDIITASKKNGVFHPYIDLNHAKDTQEPFKGYGPDNYAFLQMVAKKYDRTGVFQTLMPGGFKLY